MGITEETRKGRGDGGTIPTRLQKEMNHTELFCEDFAAEQETMILRATECLWFSLLFTLCCSVNDPHGPNCAAYSTDSGLRLRCRVVLLELSSHDFSQL